MQTLKEDLAKKERNESELTEEVKKAKQRCHKAMNLLEEWKNLNSRPPPVENAQTRFSILRFFLFPLIVCRYMKKNLVSVTWKSP